MFSQTVEYALRAMVVLADAPDTPQTAQNIAVKAQLPADYLIKVLQSLNRAGLVKAQRGKRGGFMIALRPSECTILDIVNAVEPIRRIKHCPLNLPAHGKRLCALHRKMDLALSMVEDVFRSTTLAEVIDDPSPARPLCLVQAHV